MAEEVQKYYFALYAKAGVEIESNNNPEDKYPVEWDDLTFYDKTFFCAHLRPSTYENLSCDDVEELAALVVEEQSQTKYKRTNLITKPEWIEDLCESTTVCLDPATGEEIDAFDLMDPKGFSCNWTESGMIKFGSWVEESDLP